MQLPNVQDRRFENSGGPQEAGASCYPPGYSPIPFEGPRNACILLHGVQKVKYDAIDRAKAISGYKCEITTCVFGSISGLKDPPKRPKCDPIELGFFVVYFGSSEKIYCICEVCKRDLEFTPSLLYQKNQHNVGFWMSALRPADLDTIYENAICSLVGYSDFITTSFSHSFDSLLSGESHRLASVATFADINVRNNDALTIRMFDAIRAWMNGHSDLEGLRSRVYTQEVLNT